jgi:hypothetical protein
MILMQAFIVLALYGQKKETTQTAEKAVFLAKAPVRVQEYYHVFDSLAATPQEKPVYQKWTISELKKYASMVYDANEYDPIEMEKDYTDKIEKAHSGNGQFVTTNIHVIFEVEKRISQKHAALILNPYWLTVVVDDILTIPYKPEVYRKNNFVEYRIQLRVVNVWKGKKYNIGDVVTSYYLNVWNYKGLTKGKTYIVALCPITEENYGDGIIYALGGPNDVQKSVFPIENGLVIDEDNFFKLGTKVDVGKFTEALTSTINQIKSWKGGAQ